MHPKFSAVKDLERSTLKAITMVSGFANFTELHQVASTFRRAVPPGGAPVDIMASMTMNIRLRGDHGSEECPRRIEIGALVEGDPKTDRVVRANYRMIVCEEDKISSQILRILHFDFEPVEQRNTSEVKPSFHVQLCGTFNNRLREMGYRDDQVAHFFPAFEKPRVPCIPMSLALLLHWLLLEFECDRWARTIRMDPTWKAIVCRAERELLKPFFEEGHAYLKATANEKRPFIDHCLYGIL